MIAPPKRPHPFATLNAEQREAMEHGIEEPGQLGKALLIIAGAGSGKTLTLASRVTRLVLAGADPQRVLLLTFSRRAAKEMERRVGRVLHQALGFSSTQQPPVLHWSGTFHGVGARLLREYAPHVGLNDNSGPARAGAAAVGPGRDQGTQPLPAKGHLSGDLLACGQQPVVAGFFAVECILVVCRTRPGPEAALRRLRRGETASGRARLR